jgi:hypothetical protein
MNIHFSIFIAVALSVAMCSCHSQRSVSSVTTEKTDLAQIRSEAEQSVTTDSLFHSFALSFDTLDVWIDSSLATLPEDEPRQSVRLRVIRGSLDTRQQQTSVASSSMIVADTTSVAHSSAGESQESTTKTAVYSPPDLTWLFGIAIVLLSATALIIYRSRRKV